MIQSISTRKERESENVGYIEEEDDEGHQNNKKYNFNNK